MNDDMIKDLFAAYNPQLPSDSDFMERLTLKMKAVELLKENTAAMHQRNRLAVKVALLTGFTAGVTLTLCFPHLISMLEIIIQSATLAEKYGSLSVWIIIALLTGTMSYTAYDITLFATMRMKPRKQ